MKPSVELGHLRAANVQAHWKYLGESLDLEYRCEQNRPFIQTEDTIKEWQGLESKLNQSDPKIRDAIRRVIAYEIGQLVLRCSMEIEHFVPVKRAAGML